MTLAVAEALMKMTDQNLKVGPDNLAIKQLVINEMQTLGKKYPLAGYGLHFSKWLKADQPQAYGSYGNGAAMRISPVADMNLSDQDRKDLITLITSVSHDSPEGVAGAQAQVAAILSARDHKNSEDKGSIAENMAKYYPIDFTLDEVRPSYTFDVSCEGSIPQAFVAFLEGKSFEDTIRNAISIGGDSDTIASMTGAIAEAYYDQIPDDIVIQTLSYLPADLRDIYKRWQVFTSKER